MQVNPNTNVRDSSPAGIARLLVRGLTASRSASAQRLKAIAADRAAIIATTIHARARQLGNPCAASNMAVRANGNAKIECSHLIISSVVPIFLRIPAIPSSDGSLPACLHASFGSLQLQTCLSYSFLIASISANPMADDEQSSVIQITYCPGKPMGIWSCCSSSLRALHAGHIQEERNAVHPDSSAFVADPELIRTLETRSIPLACNSDRLLFNQDDPAAGIYLVEEGGVTLTM